MTTSPPGSSPTQLRRECLSSQRRRAPVLLVAGVLAPLLLVAIPAGASLFGEENVTLTQQLVQLVGIHDELKIVSDAAQHSAEVAHDAYDLYQKARSGVDDLKRYTTDRFLADFKEDFYNQYPGFQVLVEGANSPQVRSWKDSRATSSFTAYQMISAVFGDLTDPLLKDKARSGTIETDRAYIWRYEAAGALALASEAEAWTKSSDKDAQDLYRMAANADAEQAQHLSGRALALIAAQNSHIIRLLARDVRFDGVRGAMEWAQRVGALNRSLKTRDQMSDTFGEVGKPPPMINARTLSP